MRIFEIRYTGRRKKKTILMISFTEDELQELERLGKALGVESVGKVLFSALNWLHHIIVDIISQGGTIILNHPEKGEIEIGSKKEDAQNNLDWGEEFRQAVKLGKFFFNLEEEGSNNEDV